MSKTECIFGRISVPYDFLNLKEVFQNWPHEKLIVYEHSPETGTGNRVHCHFVMINAKPRARIFEQTWWKELQWKGNRDFSFKIFIDNPKVFIYMAKGKLNPMYNTLRTDEELKNDKEGWQEPKMETIKDHMELVREYKPTKVTNYQISLEAVSEWREWALENNRATVLDDSIDYQWNGTAKKKLIRIVSEICKKYKKGRYYRNVAQICQDALCEISPAVWMDKILSML